MAEGMMIQYEHVTKMGRVGKALDPHSKKKASPQFRKLPFQDERYISQARKSSTPEPVSRDLIYGKYANTRKKHGQEIGKEKYTFFKLEPKFRGDPVKGRAKTPDMKKAKETRPNSPKPANRKSQTQDLHVYSADRTKPKAAFTPYVEMKLGRNMRAAPKGSVAGRAPPNNNPQDLIEMLNRNNHISQTQSRLEDEQMNAAARQERLEAELRRMQEEDERKQREKEAQAKTSTREDTDEVPVKNLHNTASDDTPPPPPLQSLYGSYRVKEDYKSKPSNQFITEPFTIQDMAGFNKGGMTDGSSPRTATRTGEITVEKQETVEEVEDIQEDIERDKSDEDEDNKIKDDDFNF